MALLPDRIFNVRIKLRNDSHANWKKQPNFVPMDGEIIIYDTDDEHKFQMIKIGDGITKLSQLPFINDFYTKEEIRKFLFELNNAIEQERADREDRDFQLQDALQIEIKARLDSINAINTSIYGLHQKINKLHPVELKDIIQSDKGLLTTIIFDCNDSEGPIEDNI